MSKTSSKLRTKLSSHPLLKQLWEHQMVRIGAGVLLLGLLLILALWALGISPAELKNWVFGLWGHFRELLGELHPLLAAATLFLMLAILPILPIPLTLLAFVAGLILANGQTEEREPYFQTWQIGAILGAALFVNIILHYWLAAGPARRAANWVLQRTRVQIPSVKGSGALDLTLLMRLTPVIPYFLHGLVLGFLRIPLKYYLPVSVLTSIPFTVAMGILGAKIGTLDESESALNQLKPIALILFVLMLFVVGTRMLYRKLSKKQKAKLKEQNNPTLADTLEAEIIAEETTPLTEEDKPPTEQNLLEAPASKKQEQSEM